MLANKALSTGAPMLGLIAAAAAAAAASPPPATVPLYRTFEASVANAKTAVADKFGGVTLNTTFFAPAGSEQSGGAAARVTRFWGFYDGGSTWRLRFMPSALGTWSYSWSFSDGSLSGTGSFVCVAAGASPGVLKPYKLNPHWFAYQGDTPVFLKSGPPPPSPRALIFRRPRASACIPLPLSAPAAAQVVLQQGRWVRATGRVVVRPKPLLQGGRPWVQPPDGLRLPAGPALPFP